MDKDKFNVNIQTSPLLQAKLDVGSPSCRIHQYSSNLKQCITRETRTEFDWAIIITNVSFPYRLPPRFMGSVHWVKQTKKERKKGFEKKIDTDCWRGGGVVICFE